LSRLLEIGHIAVPVKPFELSRGFSKQKIAGRRGLQIDGVEEMIASFSRGRFAQVAANRSEVQAGPGECVGQNSGPFTFGKHKSVTIASGRLAQGPRS
jgi:hypothetical protein